MQPTKMRSIGWERAGEGAGDADEGVVMVACLSHACVLAYLLACLAMLGVVDGLSRQG